MPISFLPFAAPALLLAAFIGWIVVRYSATYLDGEVRQGSFMGWLCFTLAMVMLLVIAGSLAQLVVAWTAISFGIHRLLLFYPERVAAQRAARKKLVSARLANLALLSAAVLLAITYRTSDIATILDATRSGQGGAMALAAAGLLALTALLKSAQFPLHGWLTEVMEAPTPVSALLHAGVIHAGGFLLIRFADVMLLAPGVLAVLVMIGGFTALFGGLVMLTQPAVKTSLAWSMVAQMGFMIMQSGLALFPLALLHILAHSLYKAHSFLASGGRGRSHCSRAPSGASGHPQCQSGGPCLSRRARHFCGNRAGNRNAYAISAGDRARRYSDLRRCLFARAGAGGCGAARPDAADGGLCACGVAGVFHAARAGDLADGGHLARDTRARAARMDVDHSQRVELWRGRGCAIDVPALGLSPRRRWPARPPCQWPLRQCRARPVARRLDAAADALSAPLASLERFSMPAFSDPLTTQALRTAADSAALAIPPVWPLASSVAVNPYLGNAGVRALFDNSWLHLFALDDDGRMAWRYDGNLSWTAMLDGTDGARSMELAA